MFAYRVVACRLLGRTMPWLMAAGAASCSQAPALTPQPDSTPAVTVEASALPAFPLSTSLPAAPAGLVRRRGSALELVQQGGQRIADSGGTNLYSPGSLPASLVIAPDCGGAEAATPAQRRAWSLYRFDGLFDERPQRLKTDVAQAALPGGGASLPLQYFVGVADQSLAAWQWHGPFSADADILLNGIPPGAPARCQRMIDASGVFFACILADSTHIPAGPGNAAGQVAVRLASLQVTADASVLPTRPLFVHVDTVKTGAALLKPPGGKRPAALQPSQFPVITWSAFVEPEFQYYLSSASRIELWRQGPLDSQPVKAAEFAPSKESFIDPLDLTTSIGSARGGTTYRYLLRAVNAAGPSGWASTHPLTLPMLAPQEPHASKDAPGGAGTTLGWQPVDGAVSYEVLRGSLADASDAQSLGSVEAPLTQYLDTSASPGAFYWYFVRAAGRGDGDAGNGLEAGALSPLSVSSQGLRGLVLSLQIDTPTVVGSGTAADPFRVAPGQDYAFTVRDQAEADWTVAAVYSVDPPAAAGFTGAPGVMSGVQAATGEFTVRCSISQGAYQWTGSAACRVD